MNKIVTFLAKLIALILVLAIAIFFGVYFYLYLNQEDAVLTNEVRQNLPGKFIKLTKGYVHYEYAGPDTGQAVILIHGAGSGYYAWNNNFKDLVSKGYKVLRYDLYGRGFSDRPDEIYNYELFEQQLDELIDSLKLRPPYAIVSVSMGAIIAAKYCVNRSGKINKLVMVDPAALNDANKPLMLKLPLVSDALMTLYWYPRAVQKQMKEYYDPTSVSEYAELSHAQMKYKGFKSAMKSTWLNTLNQNVYPELQKINDLQHIKVLLLWGKYDPLIPSITSEKYLSVIPRTEYFEIDSAGHLANYEKPVVVNRLLGEFLAKQ